MATGGPRPGENANNDADEHADQGREKDAELQGVHQARGNIIAPFNHGFSS